VTGSALELHRRSQARRQDYTTSRPTIREFPIAAAPTKKFADPSEKYWRSQMSNRKNQFLSLIALAGAVALMCDAAQAQYLTRPYHRSIHPYAHNQALYDAQAYAGGINVLPPTIVGGYLIQNSYDPYGNLPSVYGCCWTTHNEHVGLVGAGGGVSR
jgi:hypothetical protein